MADWRERRLGDIGKVVGGGTPSRERAEYWEGAIRWLTPAELTGISQKYVTETGDCITELGLAASGARLLPQGSLLITSRASIGSCALAGVPMATNQGFKNLIPSAEVDPLFLFHLGRTLGSEMTRRASGTTFLEISGREFERITVSLPPLEEQRRIAEILDTLDEAIQATERVVAKLELVEDGMKWDLVGLRSKADTGWDRATIGDLGTVVTGGTPPTSDERYWDGLIPFITPGDISSRGEVYVTDRRVTELGADMGKRIPPGAVAVVCIGSTIGKIGRVAEVSVTNQQINTVIPSSEYDGEFVAILLELALPILEAQAGRQAVPIVNASILRSIVVHVCSLRTQRAIAAHIGSLRDRIRRERSALSKLRQLRAGLAADLLSGRVRTVAP